MKKVTASLNITAGMISLSAFIIGHNPISLFLGGLSLFIGFVNYEKE